MIHAVNCETKRPPPGLRAYINLDALFGDVFSKLTGEPLTPFKIATFYLIRVLFETHFGYRHMKSVYPMFNAKEKAYLFHWVYALMATEKELTYKALRTVVRMAFKDDRGILINFIRSIEQIRCGEVDVNLTIEDEFYTNKHTKLPGVDPDDPINLQWEEAEKDDMWFSSHFSEVYRWLKRIMAQWTKLNQAAKFELNELMKEWIMSNEETLCHRNRLGTALPQPIDCSMRSRSWVAKNLRHIQRNPLHADPYDTILEYVKLIQKYQPDVLESYLLESVVQIQMKDAPSALKAMKTLFELSMFELNENMKHCNKTYRLGKPTQTPLMYAPILEARICRLFGDYSRARTLLQESIQQAQLRVDETCHQMGNTELHALDIIGCHAILEGRQEHEDQKDPDRRVIRKPLANIDDIYGHEPCGDHCQESNYELVTEMDSYGKMLMLLKTIAKSTYRLKYLRRNVETGIYCPLGIDLDERGERVTDYGMAIVTSNMIRNGMYQQAKSTASDILSSNLPAEHPDSIHSESHAVITVNLAYSYAALGAYPKALDTIEKMRSTYPDDLTWQSNRHMAICSAIVQFEAAFLLNRFKECFAAIRGLARYSEIEYKLRRALVLFAMGNENEAISMLKRMELYDVRGKIRRHMTLSGMYTSRGSYEMAEKELTEAMLLAEATTLTDVKAMIKRRQASLLICRHQYLKAVEIISEIENEIVKYGSFIEKSCFYLTAARSTRLTFGDPRRWLKKARAGLGNNQWPAMQLLVLSEIAELVDENGLMPDPCRLSQIMRQFEELEEKVQGKCQFLLV
uniref:Anaphase-promoting complex subunit 5 n=1 Tax=Caenorhabditis tropicalis TaxID=1561998 RepID=A0A1I7U536_9PELO